MQGSERLSGVASILEIRESKGTLPLSSILSIDISVVVISIAFKRSYSLRKGFGK